MNLSASEIAALGQRAATRAYEVNCVRWATQRGDRSDRHHPDSIRAEMARLQGLLDEAARP